jgi:uncharacterized protein GlcG (DUF336 family)
LNVAAAAFFRRLSPGRVIPYRRSRLPVQHGREEETFMTISRKLLIAGAAIGVAATNISPAGAQGLITEQRLSSTLANEAVGEAVAACAKKGYAVTAIVVDNDGVRQAVLRGDGATVHTLDSAYFKAYTAASLAPVRKETSTKEIFERITKQPGMTTSALAGLPNVTFTPGGVTIMANGKPIGAIGVGGAPGGNFDDDCARTALDKIKDRMK